MGHQTWVDSDSLLLLLDGGLDGYSMVLSGSGKNRNGEHVTHRSTWTPLDDGRVRQHWQASPDTGNTWNLVFVGLHTRVKEEAG